LQEAFKLDKDPTWSRTHCLPSSLSESNSFSNRESRISAAEGLNTGSLCSRSWISCRKPGE